jgi:chemotaxis protein methyltransferase CheR
MPVTMAPASFQLIAALVLRETSIIYEPRKEYLVEARLHPLAAQAGCADVDAYVQLLSVNPVERRKAIDALTINETSWFRDNAPYQAFTETMLPALIANRTDRRRLSIWSAACSSGQEAYSIAMLLDQHLPAGWSADILATDVSTAMLSRVENGRYSQVEMNRGLPATSLVKYFTRAGSEWEIVPTLRRMVRTRHLNLAEPFGAIGTFDLVLLRNVLIYFDQPTKHGILRRMHQHVAPDGYLLLGSSETTLDLPADLHAMWDREQIGRVQAHRPAGAVSVPRPSSPAISAALTGVRP